MQNRPVNQFVPEQEEALEKGLKIILTEEKIAETMHNDIIKGVKNCIHDIELKEGKFENVQSFKKFFNYLILPISKVTKTDDDFNQLLIKIMSLPTIKIMLGNKLDVFAESFFNLTKKPFFSFFIMKKYGKITEFLYSLRASVSPEKREPAETALPSIHHK